MERFEQALAEFFKAPFAVATDSCTHAVELCLRYEMPRASVGIPRRTYVSIPMTLEKLGMHWHWCKNEWHDYYILNNTMIHDAAVLWRKSGYVPGTLMCLSFQHKKALSLGRGGAILCRDQQDYDVLKKMSYDGRNPHEPWAQQSIATLGYHYYMTPETAQMGLDKIAHAHERHHPRTYLDYPDLSKLPVFSQKA